MDKSDLFIFQSGSCNFKIFDVGDITVVNNSLSAWSFLIWSSDEDEFLRKKNLRVCLWERRDDSRVSFDCTFATNVESTLVASTLCDDILGEFDVKLYSILA